MTVFFTRAYKKMDDPFKIYLPWYTLKEIPFLGNTTIKKLIKRFGSPENIFNAAEDQLFSIHRIHKKTIAHIRNHQKYRLKAEKELEKVLDHHYNIVALSEESYPALLKRIPDPPPVLTYIGSLENTAPCISMVGSRNATSYGLSTARHLSGKLAVKGFQIVSGLARGIDTMAHKGAIDKNGRTIAVLGSGLNHIYPRENRYLSESITRAGAVVSEFKTNAKPLREHFPVRNRTIAGISCGTVVVEAAKRSGSLITARLAGEYNREVFAVPGSIKSKKSEGAHSLLKKGARLVESELDIIDELYQFIHPAVPVSKSCSHKKKRPDRLEKPDKNDDPLLKLIDVYPVHIDVLIEKCNLDCAGVTARLLDLELNRKVIRHPGNFYSISEGEN